MVCAGVALLVATPLPAQDRPPVGDSAVNQYAEVVPGAGGPTTPGLGKQSKTRLPDAADEALQEEPVATAERLKEIATSSTYGAPTRPVKPASGELAAVPAETSLDATLRSTVTAIASDDDTRLLGLLAAVVVTTFAAVALAIRRARALD